MKKIFLFAAAFTFSLAVMAQPKADDVVKFNFEIKNIGTTPIVVENSWASCGCTTPEKIVDPIMPGSTAQLKVQYNAAAVSPFTKDVYVQFTGIAQPKTVQITGEVLSAEAYDQWVKDKGAKTKE